MSAPARALRSTFPLGVSGKVSTKTELRGDHVGREAEARWARSSLARSRVPWTCAVSLLSLGGDDGFADGFVFVERDFDFAEFDAEAVDFHLMVGAAAELEGAAGQAFREVAGAVDDGLGPGLVTTKRSAVRAGSLR